MEAGARQLEREHSITPGLAVVLVGARKDSQSYVRMKKKAAKEVGFVSVDVTLPEDTSQEDIIKEVEALNNREDIHGILVQLPLPNHVDEAAVLKSRLVCVASCHISHVCSFSLKL